MKSNQVSVLVVLLLCLVMGGFLYVVDRSSDDEKGWSPSELYSELGARSYEGSSFSDVTFSGGASSDGVAVSMRNGSFSLRTRASRASSLMPNNPIASSPNNLPSLQGGAGGRLSSPNSLIGHMTSNAEFHSFGGGSNMTMGSYASSSNNLIASSPAIGSYRPSPSSPIALSPNSLLPSSPNNLIAYSPSNGEVQVAAEQALMSASSSASGLYGGMMSSYGTASYGDYVGMSSGQPSGVRGRQNAVPGLGGGDEGEPWFSSMWWQWLDWQYNEDGSGYSEDGRFGTYDDGTGTWYFSHQDAYAAYDAWCAYMVSKGMADYEDLPSLAEWMEWFMQSKGNAYSGTYGAYEFVPIGNILPLVLMAILYMIILFVKRNKTAQL